jgi:D-alanyl-D-alanine carboxypeptidase/lipoprotein-anchoring transpeptidase ErfK/SrfK
VLHEKTRRTYPYIFATLLALALGVGLSFALTEAGAAIVSRVWQNTSALTYNLSSDKQDTVGLTDSPYARLSEGSIETLEPSQISGKFILTDLESMTVSLYEDGALTETLPILSKGKPGSPWETPAGLYDIKTKEERHFSSIGDVWMPSSMQFFGNFFIHGWPYYADGRPVPEGYSGGCIRMSVEDAERVFVFADIGTPVRVHTSIAGSTKVVGGYYTHKSAPKPPALSARSFLVADLDTRDIILEKDMRAVRPTASVGKLMTALVSLEVLNQFHVTTVSRSATEAYGDAGDLLAGERISTGNLIYPLLLSSSNDAAETLAEHQSRSWFIRQLDDKASSIGLTNTHFEDPSGFSPQNVSTARDLFMLARHLYTSKQHVLDITHKKEKSVPAGDYGRAHTWQNNNYFMTRGGSEGYIGGKTGFTDEAQHTLVAVFKLPLGEFEERTIVIVLLGSGNGEADARALLAYLRAHIFYKTKTSIVEKRPDPQSPAGANLGASLYEALRDEIQYRKIQEVTGTSETIVH